MMPSSKTVKLFVPASANSALYFVNTSGVIEVFISQDYVISSISSGDVILHS